MPTRKWQRDSQLVSLLEAEREKSFQEGLKQGFTLGREELRKELTVTADWSLAKEVLDRVMFEESKGHQYVEGALEQAMALAQSWRKGRDTKFWVDVERYLTAHYKNRMQQLRQDAGVAPAHREVMALIEGLLNLPVLAARFEKQYAQQVNTE